PFYQAADEDLEALGDRLPPGPLQVFGGPELLLRGDRSPAGPFFALRPEFYDNRAWREVYSALRSTFPIYIVVDDYIGMVISRRFPPVMEFIRSRYRVEFVGSSGTWYVRRDYMAFPAALIRQQLWDVSHGPGTVTREWAHVAAAERALFAACQRC
ncbi:MAG: hypothetical protein ACRD1T_11680, partial [Acidimicrobiia bacterium]